MAVNYKDWDFESSCMEGCCMMDFPKALTQPKEVGMQMIMLPDLLAGPWRGWFLEGWTMYHMLLRCGSTILREFHRFGMDHRWMHSGAQRLGGLQFKIIEKGNEFNRRLIPWALLQHMDRVLQLAGEVKEHNIPCCEKGVKEFLKMYLYWCGSCSKKHGSSWAEIGTCQAVG